MVKETAATWLPLTLTLFPEIYPTAIKRAAGIMATQLNRAAEQLPYVLVRKVSPFAISFMAVVSAVLMPSFLAWNKNTISMQRVGKEIFSNDRAISIASIRPPAAAKPGESQARRP